MKVSNMDLERPKISFAHWSPSCIFYRRVFGIESDEKLEPVLIKNLD